MPFLPPNQQRRSTEGIQTTVLNTVCVQSADYWLLTHLAVMANEFRCTLALVFVCGSVFHTRSTVHTAGDGAVEETIGACSNAPVPSIAFQHKTQCRINAN